MIVIYDYLERDNDKAFKFHINNSSVLEIPYQTKKCRTKFSLDKIFRRKKFSSPMKNFVRRKSFPMLKFLIHIFLCHFFHKMGSNKRKEINLHNFFKASILAK